MRLKLLFILFLLPFISLITSCVEPLEVDLQQDDDRLVINGMITDAPGPYYVTLTKTKALPYTPGVLPTVTDAAVVITDDEGYTALLTHTNGGVYKTNEAFRGRIGRAYTLSVTTRDGKKYVSAPETLTATPDIEKVSYEVEERLILDKENQPRNVFWLNAFADTKDPGGEKNYYRWEYEAVYQVETQPWDYCEYNRFGTCVPAPKNCCKRCWITLFNDIISLQTDRLVNGKDLKKQLVVKLPINNQIFNSRVHLQVKQFSISEAAYDYLNSLKTQVGSVGNIQDPPPAYIRGNISGVNMTDKEPLGFFSASAVKHKSIFITINELGIGLFPYVFADDCRVLENSTAVKPVYW